MRAMIFDTETTGLPRTNVINEETLHKWPHIVQFSYVVYDIEEQQIIQTSDFIINVSDEVIITEENSKIHGITNELCRLKGVRIETALVKFLEDASICCMFIGHNIQFDLNMIRVELMRMVAKKPNYYLEYLNFMDKLENCKRLYCTMQETVDLCNIVKNDKNGKPYVKFPKLEELHEKLFQTVPLNLHNSLNDVLITLKCFIKLKYDINIEDQLTNRLNTNIKSN